MHGTMCLAALEALEAASTSTPPTKRCAQLGACCTAQQAAACALPVVFSCFGLDLGLCKPSEAASARSAWCSTSDPMQRGYRIATGHMEARNFWCLDLDCCCCCCCLTAAGAPLHCCWCQQGSEEAPQGVVRQGHTSKCDHELTPGMHEGAPLWLSGLIGPSSGCWAVCQAGRYKTVYGRLDMCGC